MVFKGLEGIKPSFTKKHGRPVTFVFNRHDDLSRTTHRFHLYRTHVSVWTILIMSWSPNLDRGCLGDSVLAILTKVQFRLTNQVGFDWTNRSLQRYQYQKRSQYFLYKYDQADYSTNSYYKSKIYFTEEKSFQIYKLAFPIKLGPSTTPVL